MIEISLFRNTDGTWRAVRDEQWCTTDCPPFPDGWMEARRHREERTRIEISMEPDALRASLLAADAINVRARGSYDTHTLLSWRLHPLDRDRAAQDLDALPGVIEAVMDIISRPPADFRVVATPDCERLAGWPKGGVYL